VGGELPGIHDRPSVDNPKRVLRSAMIFLCVGALVFAYLMAASHAPWPVEGKAGFVWGAGLVAVAIGYVVKNGNELSPTGVRWGIAVAIVGFFLPIVLNQWVDSDYLHRLQSSWRSPLPSLCSQPGSPR
jgi:hypothetical protein